MGYVYKARDTRLKRLVALKVLRPERVGEETERRRFLREAQAAAALNHPHIVTVHEVGVEDDLDFIVMEYIGGGTLADLLAAGRLPIERVLRLAAQVIEALSEAHAAGVVHRDLKPSNIMLASPDHAKVVDFGLAKFSEAARPSSEAETLSKTGVLIGTAAYMAPEQIAGRGADARSDVWALGAVLYEMATGQRPFPEPNVMLVINDILTRDPDPPGRLNPELPAGLEKVILKALEKDPAQRYQSARELGDDLTRITAGMPPLARLRRRSKLPLIAAGVVVVSLAALLGTYLFFGHRRDSTKREAGVTRIAVLPFENLGAPGDDYFADGIADAVRGKLTSLRGVQVIARGSSTPYKKSTKTPDQIAAELDVDYLLMATVRWQRGEGSSSRVEVSPELVAISGTGPPTSKWQQPFDESLTDVFQVQSDIASKVARALGVALEVGEEKRLSEKPTGDLTAYDAFLKGEEASKGMGVTDPPSVRRALGFYEQAVALDPGFAQAWARVSAAASTLYVNSIPTTEQSDRARQAAEKAAALAPDRPEGYLALGIYEQMIASDFGRSLAQLAKGQHLAPTNAELLSWTARAEASLGRFDAAVEHLKQAALLDPRSIVAYRRLGWALLYLRRYPEARAVIERGLALAPTNLSLIQQEAMIFLGKGDLAGARAALKAAPRDVEPTALVVFLAQYWDLVWVLDEGQQDLLLRLTPGAFDDDRGTWALCLAQAFAVRGDAANVRASADEARKAIEKLLRATPDDPQRHVSLGLALAYLGRKNEAIAEGQRGVVLLPVAKDAYLGPYVQHQLARIYMLVGEPEMALDRLEPLLGMPYYLSRDWLAIDPNFDPLRKNSRFQRLVEGR
jgi:TolB-like protein/Flp pilus assembly protein TadD/predicted Ser/Thr protein kinase